MPSMRPYPLNPQLPASPASPARSPVAPAAATAAPAAAPTQDEADNTAEDEARVGGFHESSYELQHGLQISESDWPDDITLPGALDES